MGSIINMTSLSTLFGGGSSGVDPLKEGLPVVAIYGGSFNDHWDVRLHRVHSGELVASPWAAITNSTASYAHGQSSLHMFGYNNDYGQLSSGYSSHNYSSHQQYSMSMMQNDHYPYSFYGSCSKDGRMGMHSFHGSDYYDKYYRRINVVMKEGQRPRRQFNISNQHFTETHFNSAKGLKSAINLSSNSNYGFGGTAPGSDTNYGSACYNQRTKTMAVYWASSNGSQSGRMYMYRGTKDLMNETECPTVKDFIDSCSIVYQELSNVTNWGYNDISYNVNMVLGDNDFVGMNVRRNDTNRYSAFDCSTTTNNNSAVSTYSSVRSNSNTTSYGPEQGMMHRARMQLTWDCNWAAMHSPYYYYGCGTSTYWVSTKDPRRMAYTQWTANDYGGGLMPSGKSGFKIFHGQNTDGQPINNWGIELGNTSLTLSDNFNYYTSNLSYTNSESAVTNWTGSISPSFSANSFSYPGINYSTSYPRFMTVNWWEAEGGTPT